MNTNISIEGHVALEALAASDLVQSDIPVSSDGILCSYRDRSVDVSAFYLTPIHTNLFQNVIL